MKLGDFHNPDNLTPEQIGVQYGWRLLRENEIVQAGDEFWTDFPCDTWRPVTGDAGTVQRDFSYAHRTDRPDLFDEPAPDAATQELFLALEQCRVILEHTDVDDGEAAQQRLIQGMCFAIDVLEKHRATLGMRQTPEYWARVRKLWEDRRK